MDKSGVPKEAQDDALSDDSTGGRQTPTGRPTRGNVAPMTVFFLSLSFCRLGRWRLRICFGVLHKRESGNMSNHRRERKKRTEKRRRTEKSWRQKKTHLCNLDDESKTLNGDDDDDDDGNDNNGQL